MKRISVSKSDEKKAAQEDSTGIARQQAVNAPVPSGISRFIISSDTEEEEEQEQKEEEEEITDTEPSFDAFKMLDELAEADDLTIYVCDNKTDNDTPSTYVTIRSPLEFYYWLAQKPIDTSKETLNYAEPLFLAAVLLELHKKSSSTSAEEETTNLIYSRADVEDQIRKMECTFDEISAQAYGCIGGYEKFFVNWTQVHISETQQLNFYPGTGETYIDYRRDASTSNRIFLGIHYTSIENALALHGKHPSQDKLGTGNGLGKGEGFYYYSRKSPTPVKRTLRIWGPVAMAVYGDCDIAHSAGSDTRGQLKEGENKIQIFGRDEAVVPTTLFHKIIVLILDKCILYPS